MTRHYRFCVLLVCFVMPLLVPVLIAQKTNPVPAAPIPPQILTAKRVFVANAGGEQPPPEGEQFSGDSARAYNQFYAAMKTWGRYELVGAPADADLWFEIRFTVLPAARAVSKGDTLGTAAFDPQLRLVIRDPKTNAILWGFTEHAAWAILKGNRDKNFDMALARIVADVQGLSEATSADSSKK
jgi:hypothetical protein